MGGGCWEEPWGGQGGGEEPGVDEAGSSVGGLLPQSREFKGLWPCGFNRSFERAWRTGNSAKDLGGGSL